MYWYLFFLSSLFFNIVSFFPRSFFFVLRWWYPAIRFGFQVDMTWWEYVRVRLFFSRACNRRISFRAKWISPLNVWSRFNPFVERQQQARSLRGAFVPAIVGLPNEAFRIRCSNLGATHSRKTLHHTWRVEINRDLSFINSSLGDK